MSNITTSSAQTTTSLDGISVHSDQVLAQIVRVKSVQPIPKAERIELTSVLGWNVVTKKGDFKPDDLGVYFIIGSLLPETKAFEGIVVPGKPLKTKRMMGVISQGLLLPLSSFPEIQLKLDESKAESDVEATMESMDVTQLLGVKKFVYQEESDLYDNTNHTGHILFPQCVPKTEENRVQNIPKRLNEIADQDVVITQKMDGTSFTCALLLPSKNKSLESVGSAENKDQQDESKFLICGRNIVHTTPDKSNKHYFAMVEKYDIESKMKSLGRPIAIQGEICGPAINANRQKHQELDYWVFNIWDIGAQKYLNHDEVKTICQDLGLKTVPEVYRGKFNLQLPQLLKLADEQTCNGQLAEGIVVKTIDFEPRCSFKVISNKYLLKHDL